MTQEPAPVNPPAKTWDESRVVVLLIGICLLLESGLVYYQAGESQAMVSGIVGVSGLILLLFSWFVPAEEDEEDISAPLVEPTQRLVSPGTSIPSPEAPSPVAEAIPTAPPHSVTEAGLQPEPISQIPVTPPTPLPEPTPPAEVVPVAPEPVLSWFDRLRQGLQKTRSGFVKKLKTLVLGKVAIDDKLLDEIEAILYEADVGPSTVRELLAMLHKKVETDEIKDPEMIFAILRDALKSRLQKFATAANQNPNGMTVFLIIGVNGVGKTTTIAKLARKYVKEGKKVILAAGDTFRAAAIDQLGIWGDRAGAEVIKGKEGGDPGALVFDAIHAAKKREADYLIIDTAGRMHVKANLMDELKKIKKIAEKETDGGPHEILLVIDSTTGQNAVQQAKLFNEALPISGLIMTKLDGTAKGGVVFAVQENLAVPVKFIGVGEKMDDLLAFNPDEFLEALFAGDEGKTKESDYSVL
jgi:fused signal recognition particle receptor